MVAKAEQEKTTAPKIFAAISAVMKDVEAVGKTEKNSQQNFNFRGIEGIYNAISKTMAKHGVFTTHKIIEKESVDVKSRGGAAGCHVKNHYVFTFHAVDGSSVDTEAIGEGIDYGDKCNNKCLSIAHKYALVTTLCLPYKLDDPDSEGHEIKSPPAPSKAVVDKEKEIKGEKAKLAATMMKQLGLMSKQARLDHAKKVMKKTATNLTLKDWDKFLDKLDKAVREVTAKAEQAPSK